VGLDAVFLIGLFTFRLLNGSPENDEILVDKILEFGVFEELLTEQFAAPSGIGGKVEEDLFVFGSGFCDGFVQGAFEKDLGRSRRNDG
jgi:hypothetical protein